MDRVSRQVGAIPVRTRRGGGVEVLLITTRGAGHWTVPKGWPMRGRGDAGSAAREAEEEAGVVGRIGDAPVGSFRYAKRRGRREEAFDVTLYRLDVTGERRRWRERGQRRLRWLPPECAARLVAWPGLAAAIRGVETTPARPGPWRRVVGWVARWFGLTRPAA